MSDDLKPLLLQLLTKVDAVHADVAGLKTDVAGLTDRVARLEVRVDTGFQVVNARLDEQRSTIAALIPQRIAAVGRTDAAE